jgi:hypothetical protein
MNVDVFHFKERQKDLSLKVAMKPPVRRPMKFVIILLCALAPFFICAQGYFEGSIHYANEITVKNKKINLVRLQQTLGKGSILLFKEGNFRHNYDGGIFEFELYNRIDNRLYMKKRENDTIYWYDCSKGGSIIKDLKTSTQRKKVLGILCNGLRIQYSDHIKVEYYNSDSISVDPKWFLEFKRNDQHRVDAIEKSIFLRSEIDYSTVTIVSQATKIAREALSMSLFEIPSDAILLKKE